MLSIYEIAQKAGIDEEYLEPYGKYMAKINLKIFNKLRERKGKLIIVTAMSPTRFGEGKTTNSIGLAQALNRLGKSAIVTLREPSLGPVFGIKGGATGGGKSRVLPSENINLHFTGDIHAVSAAHNLLSAMLDNHLHFGNELGINIRKIFWPRAIDMNDRALRNIVIGLGGTSGGIPREDHFIISVASEVMAILALAKNYKDLKERLAKIIVAISKDKKIITAKDLKADGAMAVLLTEALKPNLVQTTEGTPAFVHAGPFANIAHGTNSVLATDLALRLSDYVITETGFGSDLGAEKFVNFVSRVGNFDISAMVLVVSIRAIKHHGNGDLEKGFENVEKHIENIKQWNLPAVVAINRFPDDTDEEIQKVMKLCEKVGANAAVSEAFAKGGEGAIELAEKVIDAVKEGKTQKYTYDWDDLVDVKIEKIAKEVYGAKGVEYTAEAKKDLKFLKKHGFDKLPVIVSKTQYSLSDNPKLLGRPKDFTVTVRNLIVNGGAGFVVALMGDILLIPGLPREPAAHRMYIDDEGNIYGVF